MTGTISRMRQRDCIYFTDHAPTDWWDLLHSHDFAFDVRFRKALIDRGIYYFPVAAKQGSISFAHSNDDIDQTIEMTREALAGGQGVIAQEERHETHSFWPVQEEKPGVELAGGVRKDCSQHFADWNSEFLGGDGLAKLAELVKNKGNTLPDVPKDARLGAPVARPGKVICIGLNYADHAAESGMAVPTEPIVFMKGSNTVVGPYDDVLIPRGSAKTRLGSGARRHHRQGGAVSRVGRRLREAHRGLLRRQ